MTSQIAILMSNFQGQEFISEQLKSISSQNHYNWNLYVSDDDSTDDTLNILKSYKEKWGA